MRYRSPGVASGVAFLCSSLLFLSGSSGCAASRHQAPSPSQVAPSPATEPPPTSNPGSTAGQKANPTEAAPIASPLGGTLEKLRAIKLEEMQTSYPPEAVPLMEALQSQLREALVDEVGRLDLRIDGPAATGALMKALAARGATIDPPTESEWPLGQLLELSAERPEGRPELLIVTLSTAVICGRNDSLYLFAPLNGRWSLRHQLEPGAISDRGYGQEGLSYALAPPRPDGSLLLLATWSTPWCTSCWNSLDQRAILLNADGTSRSTLYSAQDAFYRCEESEEAHAHASVDPEGFTIRFMAGSRDSDLWGRNVIHRFKIEGEQSVLVPVSGLSPTDMVDEWLRLSWSDAARWVLPGKPADALEPTHRKLQGDDFGTFEMVQPCEKRKDSMLVRLALQPEGAKGSSWYFLLKRQDGVLYVEEVGQKRPGGCPGETAPGRAE